jgi:L1 cell adhesion molecule like protein
MTKQDNHKQNDYVLGIDLGTTNCCCAVYINDKIEIIPNASGNRTTPSYISFYENEKLVGESAKNVVSSNSQNTVFDIKRLIGRKYDDKYVQTDMKHFPFKIIKDKQTEKPLIRLNYYGEEKNFLPEQLSAFLLYQLKSDAVSYLGCDVDKVVITVPAYFNNEQRESTKIAGEIAGLKVIRIINEPTASAIAYGINLCENEKHIEKHLVVFDFGGGTLDVSVLNIIDGVFEVKSTSGDTHLGGEDCDNKLVSFCASEFSKTNKLSENDIRKLIIDTKALRRLRTVCENAKKILSTALTTYIQIDSFYNGIDLSVKLSRAKFEELCNEIFNRCIEPLDMALMMQI